LRSNGIPALQRVTAGAVVTETVALIPVDEGRSVRRGDVLIELDDRDVLRPACSATRRAVDR
jgi:multidrug efflux pump subunit AcrA (membrane-fusion protein)